MDHRASERLLHRRLGRRQLLIGAAALTSLGIVHPSTYPVAAQPKFPAYPFSLGVASGEPRPNSVVLWTRLAPNPLGGSGMPTATVPVQWQVATDTKMAKVVAKGTALAKPELGHAVHILVDRLEPGRWYWYQFKAGREISPIGRTRTAPNVGDRLDRLSFAFVSCQHYEKGYFTAYRHLAAEALDVVFHLGDYIYEGAPREGRPRKHVGPKPVDLDTYRLRYALYKSDPDLRAAHAAAPFICTWDDHEVENDYAGEVSQKFEDPDTFLQRRAAAYQAYYEHMPLSPTTMLQALQLQLNRRFTFGDLVEFSVLDNRQYRDDHPCDDNGKGGGQVILDCSERWAPQRTMLGEQQERWLLKGLAHSSARWTVIAQQQLMAELKQLPGNIEAYWSEGWDGYAANRRRILEFIQQHRPSNPVVIGGDLHSFWVTDLKPDFRDPNAPVVATEFIGTSISSNGPSHSLFSQFLPHNPHIKFFESRWRGYVQCTVDREQWISNFRVVDTVATPESPVRTLATYRVINGQPRAELVQESST